jgi:hypothetical protein
MEHIQIVRRPAGFGRRDRCGSGGARGEQLRRQKIVVRIRQVHPDMIPLPDIAGLLFTGKIIHDDRERVAAVNHHRPAARQVVAKVQERGHGRKLGVTADQYETVIAKAHAPAGNVIL